MAVIRERIKQALNVIQSDDDNRPIMEDIAKKFGIDPLEYQPQEIEEEQDEIEEENEDENDEQG